MTGERVVWKYPFPPGEDRLELELPETAAPVLFAVQGTTLAVWIDRPVREDGLKEKRSFLIVGTGHEYPGRPWQHVGSALVDGGLFVFHLYQRASS
jgi:hypothetical protein